MESSVNTGIDTGGSLIAWILGLFGVTASGLSLNEWYLAFGLLLLLIRLPTEVYRLIKNIRVWSVSLRAWFNSSS